MKETKGLRPGRFWPVAVTRGKVLMEGFPDTFEVVDLTHTISPLMPVFPGSRPPDLLDLATVEEDGFAERRISFDSHTGTHVDAPAHLLRGGRTLDDFPAGGFVGSGAVLDLARPGSREIRLKDLAPFRSQIEGRDFVLLCTGRSRAWGQPSYLKDYPVLSEEAARWLAGLAPRGVGVDAISVDPVDAKTLTVHRVFLERSILVLENLAGLERLLGREFLLFGLPLKIIRAEGAPVRAVALLAGGGKAADAGV